jgi:uncharacterized protein
MLHRNQQADVNKFTAAFCITQIFFNKPLIVKRDSEHSQLENRYYVLGRTNIDRLLFSVFTVRNNKIRIISARDMTDSEIERYKR